LWVDRFVDKNMIQAQEVYEALSETQKINCLHQEIQNIYILLKEASRDEEESVTQSHVKLEDEAIRKMDLFVVIEYIRAAIKILL
jgi:hypothetical protein